MWRHRGEAAAPGPPGTAAAAARAARRGRGGTAPPAAAPPAPPAAGSPRTALPAAAPAGRQCTVSRTEQQLRKEVEIDHPSAKSFALVAFVMCVVSFMLAASHWLCGNIHAEAALGSLNPDAAPQWHCTITSGHVGVRLQLLAQPHNSVGDNLLDGCRWSGSSPNTRQ